MRLLVRVRRDRDDPVCRACRVCVCVCVCVCRVFLRVNYLRSLTAPRAGSIFLLVECGPYLVLVPSYSVCSEPASLCARTTPSACVVCVCVHMCVRVPP